MNDIRVVSLVAKRGFEQVMTTNAEARLRSFATLVKNERDVVPMPDEMGDLLAQADACLTGWGVRIPESALVGADRLKIIGHMGGTVKRVVPLSAYARGIVVTHAAPVIAKSVGEMALGLTIAGLRCIVQHDAAFKQGGTYGDLSLDYSSNRGLHGSRVGIIGASRTGREFIKLLQAFGDEVEICMYDPYLPEHAAGRLGVRKVELAELLCQSDVVSLHAPATDETYHMIGAVEIGMLKDGALLVNTARGRLIDHDALLAELKTGRIGAALDVYLETLSRAEVPTSEYRHLNNVIITPGRAGPSIEVRRQLGEAMVDEFARFFSGLEPLYRVNRESLPSMA
jgi:phosphoglycerate dehydrogenase-like enzyme